MFLRGREKNTNEIMTRLCQADFTQQPPEGEEGKLYRQYQSCFESMKKGIDQIELAAEQVEGVIDQIEESSEKVNYAVRFLADGSARQAKDVAESCNVALQLTGRIREMSEESEKMIS